MEEAKMTAHSTTGIIWKSHTMGIRERRIRRFQQQILSRTSVAKV
jgi:hypothetical protein